MTDPFERAVNSGLAEHARRGFRIHLFVYVAVHVLLFAIWAGSSGVGEGMPWPVYSLLGWGIGVVAHYMSVRGVSSRSRPPSA